MLHASGIKELLPDAIQWLFTTNTNSYIKDEWRDVGAKIDLFELSSDGLVLTIQDVTEPTIVKVVVKQYSSTLEAKQSVKILGKLVLSIPLILVSSQVL